MPIKSGTVTPKNYHSGSTQVKHIHSGSTTVWTHDEAPEFLNALSCTPRFINDALTGNIILSWNVDDADRMSLLETLADGSHRTIATSIQNRIIIDRFGRIDADTIGYRKTPLVGSKSQSDAYYTQISNSRANSPNTNDLVLDDNVDMYDALYIVEPDLDWEWDMQHISTNADNSNTYEVSPANTFVFGASGKFDVYADAAHTIPVAIRPDDLTQVPLNGNSTLAGPMQNATFAIEAIHDGIKGISRVKFYRWLIPTIEIDVGPETISSTVGGTELNRIITVRRGGIPLPVATSWTSSFGTHVGSPNTAWGNGTEGEIRLIRLISEGSQPASDTIRIDVASDLPSDVIANPRTAFAEETFTWSGFGG